MSAAARGHTLATNVRGEIRMDTRTNAREAPIHAGSRQVAPCRTIPGRTPWRFKSSHPHSQIKPLLATKGPQTAKAAVSPRLGEARREQQ